CALAAAVVSCVPRLAPSALVPYTTLFRSSVLGGGLDGVLQRDVVSPLVLQGGGDLLHLLPQGGPGAAHGAGDDAARLALGAQHCEPLGELTDALIGQDAFVRADVRNHEERHGTEPLSVEPFEQVAPHGAQGVWIDSVEDDREGDAALVCRMPPRPGHARAVPRP